MAKSELFRQLSVQLPAHRYPIYIGSKCLSDVDLLHRHVASRQVLIVSNETIAPLYLHYLLDAFKSFQCDTVVLPDGEAYKNQHHLFKIYNALINHQHHRDTTLIALGGGVIGDITGFAAATYQRGVRLIQLPTSLLAQVDASVGGKTAINLPHSKNMIGSFYQPHAVIIDMDTLASLPMREYRSGMAEIIKYSLLAGGDFLTVLQGILNRGIASSSHETMANLIAESCKIKMAIVEQDERETGQRALLNLGHTVAHALEAYTSFEVWRHGEAVGIGLFCAALLSYQLGYMQHSDLLLIDGLLKAAGLPRRIPKAIDLHRLHALIRQDKKIQDQQLRFVLIKAPGDCFVVDSLTSSALQNALDGAVEEV